MHMNPNILDEIIKYTPLKRSGRNKVKTDQNTVEDNYGLYRESNHILGSYHSVILYCLILISILLLLSRAFSVQIIKSNSLAYLADKNMIRENYIYPERGVIYDRNENVLARNLPSFGLELNLKDCAQIGCEKITLRISDIIGQQGIVDESELEPEKVKKILLSPHKSIVLFTSITKDQLVRLEPHFSELPGVSAFVSPLREYPYRDALAHVLGYVGLDNRSFFPLVVGKMGMEEYYDQYLAGIPGDRIIKTDSRGVEEKVLAERNAFPGKNIHLYLDAELSKKAYDLLKKVVDGKKATAGAIVAQDPSTGGILALVNYPSFDPNKLSQGITAKDLNALSNDKGLPFFNRAISGMYPPGSVFKMVIASAALEEKVVTERTTIDDKGFIQVGSYIFKNWKPGGQGIVDLRGALQQSNDTYFYTVGGGYGGIKGLEISKLADWARRFGYGALTKIDIWGEAKGYFPDGTAKTWYLGDTYITSIGQGDVLATPLQINNVTNYFANGGYLLTPRVVKNVDGVGDQEVEVISQNLTSAETYNVVREGMKMAVSPGGTAYPLFDFPARHRGVFLAGKTGTAEYNDSEGKAGTHAWFTVFGPYDKATISLTVFLEGGGSGSDDAAPIAKELLDLWFSKPADQILR